MQHCMSNHTLGLAYKKKLSMIFEIAIQIMFSLAMPVYNNWNIKIDEGI